MLWWIETMERHFQTDVIEPGLRGLLERIGGGGAEEGDEAEGEEEDGETETGAPESTAASTVRQKKSTREREDEQRKRLDFTSIKNLHSLYLEVVFSGLLLGSNALREKMVVMMDVAEEFCARVERWGGDVLPGFLEGSLSAEESSQREFGSSSRGRICN